MKVEKLHSHYISQVAEIEKECFSVPWSYESFVRELNSDIAHYFIVSDGNIVAGYIGVHIVLGEGYITNVAVKSLYRNKGIGKILVTSVIDCCVDKGCCLITLEVRKSNKAAIQLYKKFGFNFIGIRKNYYTKPIEDAIIMTLNF